MPPTDFKWFSEIVGTLNTLNSVWQMGHASAWEVEYFQKEDNSLGTGNNMGVQQ